MNLSECACGGVVDHRGGLVSNRYWLACRVCGTTTGLHDSYDDARAAWRAGNIKLAKPDPKPSAILVAMCCGMTCLRTLPRAR